MFFHFPLCQWSQSHHRPTQECVAWRTVSPTRHHRSSSLASSGSGPWQKQSADASNPFLSLLQSIRFEDHDLLISSRSRCKQSQRSYPSAISLSLLLVSWRPVSEGTGHLSIVIQRMMMQTKIHQNRPSNRKVNSKSQCVDPNRKQT